MNLRRFHRGYKIQILGDPCAIFLKRVHVTQDPLFSNVRVLIVQVDVQEINEPGHFDFI